MRTAHMLVPMTVRDRMHDGVPSLPTKGMETSIRAVANIYIYNMYVYIFEQKGGDMTNCYQNNYFC